MPAPLPTLTLIGRRLRAARLAKGWTQAHLGELLGLGEPNTAAPRISRYERGMHEPDLTTIEQLAKILGLPTAYFYASSDVLAEAILLIATLTPKKQREALELLKGLVTNSAPTRRGKL